MSPFEIFRRNLKPAMVVLTALSLFAFVVLPALDTYLRSGNANNTDVQVASFDGVPLRQSRIEYFTRNHNTTIRFLRKLADETIRRGGAPRTPGFNYDSQNKIVRATGINENPNGLNTVRTLQFAAEAEKAGFELDDTAVKSWLQQFTDGTMSDSEIMGLLAKTSRNSMGQFHLFEQLRAQLMASLYQKGAAATIVTEQQLPLATPVQTWTNFLKLNRKATADAYGLLVQDYYDKTDANPTASEIQAVYEEGKDTFPNSESPNPAFRRRDTATFEYVVAEMQTFIDAEVAKLTEEEIRAEYDKRVAGGAFKLPDNAVQDMLKEASEANDAAIKKANEEAKEKKADASETAEESTKEETKAADVADMKKDDSAANKDDDAPKDAEKKDAEKKDDAPKKDAAPTETKEPAVEKDGDAKKGAASAPAEMKKADADNATAAKPAKADAKKDDSDEKKEASKDEAAKKKDAPKKAEKITKKPSAEEIESNKKQVEDFKKELDAVREEAAKEADAGDADQSQRTTTSAVKLVLFQDEEKKDTDNKTEEKEDPKDSGDKPAPESKDAEAKTDEAKPDESKPDESKPDESKPDETKSDDDKAANVDDKKDDSKPKVQSFEDVRRLVAESMVSQTAGDKLSKAVNEVTGKMRDYFNLRAIHDSNVMVGNEGDPPVRPDLEKLAEERGLKYQKIGPHDIVTLRDEPIANSAEMGTSFGQRGPPFAAMMYGFKNGPNEIPKQQLFYPLGTVDVQTRKTYVSWKIDEADAYTPELDECREEVIKAIRMSEARDLARAAADEIVAKLAKGEAIEDLIPDDKKINYKKDLGPFSWMNTFGFGQAVLGNVPQLDSVGEEFMGKVFSTKVGEYGVAANLPERVVYVVKPTDFQPQMQDLRAIFKQPMSRRMAMLLGTEDAGSIYQGFYEAMDERTGFQYAEPSEE